MPCVRLSTTVYPRFALENHQWWRKSLLVTWLIQYSVQISSSHHIVGSIQLKIFLSSSVDDKTKDHFTRWYMFKQSPCKFPCSFISSDTFFQVLAVLGCECDPDSMCCWVFLIPLLLAGLGHLKIISHWSFRKLMKHTLSHSTPTKL